MLYPLCVHRTIKVDSILYQKFALRTYSPFRHEVSLLYFSRNNLLRVLTYVCRHWNVYILSFFLFFRALDSEGRALYSDGRALHSEGRALHSEGSARHSEGRALHSEGRRV